MSSELVRLCGSTSRRLISQKAPRGASPPIEGGYRTGSMANSVLASGSASIFTRSPMTFTARTRSPRETRGVTQTLTVAQGSSPFGPTNLLRIPSMLTSSPKPFLGELRDYVMQAAPQQTEERAHGAVRESITPRLEVCLQRVQYGFIPVLSDGARSR